MDTEPLAFPALTTMLKAAGEATRLRILALIAEAELTVSDLTEILRQSQPRLSRHLRLLAEAGLVERFREGSWAFFRLGERGADRLFDGGISHMEFADAIPFRGVPAEIILRRGGARRAHRGEPLAVAGDDRIVGIEPRDHRACDIGSTAALAQTEERPRAFAEALDQSGLGEEAQMPRQPRLRLAQDLGEVGDRELGFGDQRQDAQSRGFASCLEHGGQGWEGEELGVHGKAASIRYKDIFIRVF